MRGGEGRNALHSPASWWSQAIVFGAQVLGSLIGRKERLGYHGHFGQVD